MKAELLHPKYWPTWLGLAILRLISCLPFHWQQSIASWVGRNILFKLKRRRHIAEVNISICFPELSAKAQKQLVEANLISTAQGAIETAYSWWASDDTIRARSALTGEELIEQANKEGRGVLLIGAHYTTLDLAGRVIGLHQDLDITYKDQRNKASDYCINRSRRQSFKNLIEKNEMRKMVKLLKSGRTVWYAPDQDFGRKGAVFAPFFGHPAATITTVGKLLKISNAKPLFYSLFRVEKDGEIFYQGRIHDPFDDNFGDDDMANATLLNKAIEDVIREHPEQYLWVHERFRSRPDKSIPRVYSIRKKKKKKKK